MSRWLKSVNTLLETLDDRVEHVVDETNEMDLEFDDQDYDSDDYDSEYESEELQSDWDTQQESSMVSGESEVEPYEEPLEESTEEEGEVTAVPVMQQQPPPPPPPPPPEQEEVKPPPVPATVDKEAFVGAVASKTPAGMESPIERAMKPPPPPPPLPPAKPADSKPAETPTEPAQGSPSADKVVIVPPEKPPVVTTKSPPRAPMSSGMSSVETPPPSGHVSLPATSSTATTLQQQLKRSNRELKKVQSEARQLRKHVMQLNAQLESTENEMVAQREELQRAAERMERDRNRHNEEREDLLEEHDEELDQQKEHYEKLLGEQKDHFEDQIEDLQDRLEVEEEKRMQEGGDWTKELEDSIQREREALKRLGETKDENAKLQSRITKLEAQQNALQTKLESSIQNAQTASERERQAEDKLDAALSLHSRQLGQRQARESELERTIADLGAALTVARQKEQSRTAAASNKTASDSDSDYKKQLELATEELETVRVQLSMETQRCEALRQELHEVSQERTDEASAAHARQQQHDRQVADLTSNVARLEATVRELKRSTSTAPITGESISSEEDARVRQLMKEGAEMKRKVASLSEQLMRLQDKNENSKSEVLALKNRLQGANARAQSAEQALASAQSQSTSEPVYQTDAGSVSYGSSMRRRRFKGGRRRSSPSSVRSIRSAVNMSPGRVSENMEPIAQTLDAIDSVVVETGAFLRHEPLARLAFILYLVLLHLWAFCLVLFHAHSFEKEHGDFGSFSENGGIAGGRAIRGGRHP